MFYDLTDGNAYICNNQRVNHEKVYKIEHILQGLFNVSRGIVDVKNC
jgi:hypothetical protein